MASAPANSAIVSQRAAWLLLAAVVLLWGANWPVMKVGLAYIPPLTFAATRMLLGSITMFAVAALTGQLRLPTRHDWPLVLGIGLMQMGGFIALVTFGLQYVPAGRSAILAYTTSLWVVPMATLVLGERLAGLRLIGFGLGFAGVLTLFNPFGFDWSDPDTLTGNGLLLVAALLWAIMIIAVRGRRMEGSPLALAPWQFAVAAALIAPFAALTESAGEIRWTTELGIILFYNGPVATAFGFWAMITITRALPAITTSLASLGVPLVGLVLSSLFIGESADVTLLLGLVLIVSGVAAVSLADQRRAARFKPD